MIIIDVGQFEDDSKSEILKLDLETSSWIVIGELKIKRKFYAVTTLPMSELEPYCTDI